MQMTFFDLLCTVTVVLLLQMNMVDEADDPTIDKPSKRRSVETPPSSPGPKRRKVGQYPHVMQIDKTPQCR